jgi:hypothetical protein
MKRQTITRKRKTSTLAAGALAFQTPAGWASCYRAQALQLQFHRDFTRM